MVGARIEELKRELHDARVKRGKTEAAKLKVEDELETKITAYRTKNAEVYDADAAAEAECGRLEFAVREAAVAIFNATKNKKLTPGIDVKESREYDFKPTRALEWAKEKGLALKLDDAAFKAICQSEDLRPDFVTEHKIPKAYIAKDLSIHVTAQAKDALPAAA